MFTLDSLRTNRTALFWMLHSIGWGAYAITQFFGALLFEKSVGYLQVITVATISGFLLSIPLRFLFRRLWGKQPLAIIVGVLLSCYLTALALRVIINIAYTLFSDEHWEMKTRFEIFGGALSTSYLLLCYAGMYFGIKYAASLQEQREATLKAVALAQEAQLKMLRYQLNPHFLFNTLNAISTLILDNQNLTANRAVSRLAEFLRYTLDQEPTKKVTLRQELDALDLYLGTERLRFGERLRISYAIEEAALDGLMPSLLLQPLIENSLKYAVAPREAGGSICIEGRVNGSTLEIVVADDGPGINENCPTSSARGVGLRNTRERLSVLYGERHQFIVVNGPTGLRIELLIPFEKPVPLARTS